MLISTYTHTMDPKGRIFIPSKFRDELGEKIIITQGIKNCLFGFSESAWMEFASKLTAIPTFDKTAQKFSRILCSSACECSPDKQGRILLPQRLRDYAGIIEEVVVNGALTRIELWGKECWEEYCSGAMDEYEEAIEKLAELGI